MEASSPDASKLTVRQRRVARYLRGWLSTAEPKTNQAALAKELGWSPAKLNKFLTAKSATPTAEIIAIATMLRVPDAERDRVVRYSRGGTTDDAWWHSFSGDALKGDITDFVETEAEASSVRNVQMALVPGLLQTADYASALLRSWLAEANEPLIEERSRLRARRQARLTDAERPLTLHALIHESALEQEIGGSATMLNQLDYLLEVSELPTVVLQVIPTAIGAYPGFGSAYHLIDFDDRGASAVYLDNLSSGLYIEAEDGVDAYTLNFKRLLSYALDPSATVGRIKEIRARRDA